MKKNIQDLRKKSKEVRRKNSIKNQEDEDQL